MTQLATHNQLIYVIDDEPAISGLVSLNLVSHGYRARQFNIGPDALANLQSDSPDLVILGIPRPEVSGLEIARQIRRLSSAPLLLLSVRAESSVLQAALNLGAGDYIIKPFHIDELMAWVRVSLRRPAPPKIDLLGRPYSYRSGDLLVDLDGLRVTIRGSVVPLTPKEWAMLRVLVRYAGQVVSSGDLLRESWGPEYGIESDYIRTYIGRLRRKLEPDSQSPRYILLERGLGYRLAEPD